MATNLTGGKFHADDTNGLPLLGGLVYTYTAGTTTPLATYTTSALSVQNTNPVVLNERGEASIWLSDVPYRIIVRDISGVTVYDQDNINATGVTTATLAASTGAAGVGANDASSGAKYTTVQGFITYLLSSAGAAIVGFSRAISYAAGSIGARLKADAFATDAPYNAVGDDSTNNAAAFALIQTDVNAGIRVHFPRGTYRSTVPLNFTDQDAYVTADYGTRIKLTANNGGTPWVYVMQFDYSAGAGFARGGYASNFILDGGGFAQDGLSLKGVVSGIFPNIRATNVTRAGLHLWWAQVCEFANFTCSANVEAFTTTPVNGVLADTASSSANYFTNICIEGVSGDGILGTALIASTLAGGTSEGNGGAGIKFGASSGALTAINNTVSAIDLEVNTGGDIVLEATADCNNFLGLVAGFTSSPSIDIRAGATRNSFYGGITGQINIASGCVDNAFYNVSLLTTGNTITDAAPATNRTVWRNIRNIGSNTTLTNSDNPDSVETLVANGGTYTVDAKLKREHFVSAQGATMTIANPTNPQGGASLDITISNISGGALTVSFGANIRSTGWVDPANGANRTISLRYFAAYGRWYLTSVSPADVAN